MVVPSRFRPGRGPRATLQLPGSVHLGRDRDGSDGFHNGIEGEWVIRMKGVPGAVWVDSEFGLVSSDGAFSGPVELVGFGSPLDGMVAVYAAAVFEAEDFFEVDVFG